MLHLFVEVRYGNKEKSFQGFLVYSLWSLLHQVLVEHWQGNFLRCFLPVQVLAQSPFCHIQGSAKCRSTSLIPFLLSFLPSHIFPVKEKFNDHPRGQFAGMSVNIFSTTGVKMPECQLKFPIQGGQLSGTGGQLFRNWGSINFGIYSLYLIRY